jgi:PST family polysaccharide transporter
VVLSVYGLLFSVSWHAGDVFKAIGRPSLLLATGTGRLALMVGPVWWAAGHSIVMVALMLVAVELVLLVVNTVLLRRVGGITPGQLWNAVGGPLPAAAGMGVIMVAIAYLMTGLPAPLILVAAGAAGVLTYILGLQLSAPSLFEAGLSVVRRVRGQGADEAASSVVTQPRNHFVITVLVMIGLSPVITAVNSLRQLGGSR